MGTIPVRKKSKQRKKDNENSEHNDSEQKLRDHTNLPIIPLVVSQLCLAYDNCHWSKIYLS